MWLVYKLLYFALIDALTAVGALMTLTDFTLSNARRFYLSREDPFAVKGLTMTKNYAPTNALTTIGTSWHS